MIPGIKLAKSATLTITIDNNKRCGAKLTYNHRLTICPRCGFIAYRDTVGAMNIYLKAVKMLALRHGSWGTHLMTYETRPKGGSIEMSW